MDFRHFFDSKKISFIAIFAVLTTFSVVQAADTPTVNSAAIDSHGAHGEGEFQPTDVIMEHISDAHDWHLWGHSSIPLPVILYTDKGFEFFLSSQFHHGEHDYRGKHYTYRLVDKKKIQVVNAAGQIDEEASKKIWDFSITKNVASMFLSVFLLLLIFTSVAKAYKKREGKAPKGLQSFLEPIILFVRDDIARPNIGHKYARFMPLLLTIFFFIWINNLMGLIPIFPGAANVTGNIAVTFVLAFIVLIVVNVNGNKYYWKHILLPDVPWWLYPIMIPVELVGVISRPFALMIRLFANITAGHIIILSLISLIFVFKSLAIAPVSLAFVLFMNVLELLVAALQAFIFTLLTALFIGMAVEEHH
ncbi:F-type H+-transporting ATPase subunit a [Parapedobacter composti]|uniref:ATP synthase subunit a n=1 Tax=Parapedobacter composti TaxID=623281 RepID=A0A1I1I7N1_9SPHI|nr:F0F1 ATP synthase subunit A [Parapedobacter composti]SFC32186.1 F-type H+-transporting ATPase subunit a [Parapedobacter composti]